MSRDPSSNNHNVNSNPNNKYIDTNSLSIDLKKRALQSGFITFAAQPIKLTIGIGSTIVLARLLNPADFGLVAMVTPLIVLINSLRNFGLETALIQQEGLEHEQVSALFWLSLKINAVVLAFMLLMAPVLAWFYSELRVIGITVAMAVGILGLCLAVQHESLLKRQMRFGALTLIEMGAIFAGATVAIAAAFFGAGYWALVLQIVVMQLTQSVSFWLVCGWRPAKYVINSNLDTNLRTMISYGVHLTGFRFINRIGTQLDQILIGYFSGAASLGLYSVAQRWAYFPFDKVYIPLFDVAVSSLSRAQKDPNMYRAYCKKAMLPLFALCMPALAFSFVEARNVILVLLGNQWLDAVPLFQLLAIAVFVGSMNRVTKWLYLSGGQTQRQFRWGLISTPVMILAVAIGAKWKAYGVAMGFTLGTCLITYPSIAFCLKTLPLSVKDFWGVVWRPAFASLAAAAILFASRPILHGRENVFLELFGGLTIFALAYILIWIVLPGGQQALTESLKNLQVLRLRRKD